MLNLYATCPPSRHQDPDDFRQWVRDVARWTDRSECRGLLVFTDNAAIDPWPLAQHLIELTERLVPLVAAQPPYLHPFTVARMVSSLGYMYGRNVDINLVTGGNRYQLRAVGSDLDHDARYERLVEFGAVVNRLLVGGEPLTYQGAYYDMVNAYINPPLDERLMPRFFVAGSSAACVDAGRALGVVRLTYPHRIEEYAAETPDLSGTGIQPSLSGAGIRLGIIARDSSEAAWREAHQRYPDNPAAPHIHAAARKITESRWYHRLSATAPDPQVPDETYWLYPFRACQEYCPYLVGSYDEVGALLAGYLELGVDTLILSVPREEDDLYHASIALRRAEKLAAARRSVSSVPNR